MSRRRDLGSPVIVDDVFDEQPENMSGEELGRLDDQHEDGLLELDASGASLHDPFDGLVFDDEEVTYGNFGAASVEDHSLDSDKELKAIDAAIQTIKKSHNLNERQLTYLFGQLLDDIKTYKERKAQDEERRLEQNQFWLNHSRAAAWKAQEAIKYAGEIETFASFRMQNVAEIAAPKLDDARSVIIAAEKQQIQEARKKSWQDREDQIIADDQKEEQAKQAFDEEREDLYEDEKVETDGEREESWKALKEARKERDDFYKVEQSKAALSGNTLIIAPIADVCDKYIYQNAQSGLKHTGEALFTAGRGIKRATEWLATGARECFEFVITGIGRAATFSGRHIAEAAQTAGVGISRATDAPFYRFGNTMSSAATCMNRFRQDINPAAASRRAKEKALLGHAGLPKLIQDIQGLKMFANPVEDGKAAKQSAPSIAPKRR